MENLADGYHVRGSVCYEFQLVPHQTLPIQCLEELVFAATVKNVLVKYVDGVMSVLMTFVNFERLITHTEPHTSNMITWQTVQWQISSKL